MSAILFGKLPGHGDFLCRGLSGAERRWWDDGLTRSLDAARDEFGDDFATLFDHAPPWRFRIDGPLSGVVAMSVDRAGRRFPLVAARRAAGGAAGCEGAVFDAFARGDGADELQARLDAVKSPVETEPTGWWLDGGEALGASPLPPSDPVPLVPAMLGAARRLLERERVS